MDGAKDPSAGPPRAAERILGFLHSDQSARTHLGDFEEVYNEIRSRRGAGPAGLWYCLQILLSIPGFIRVRFYWSAVMFKNYLIISLRNLIRDRGISLINLGGLAVGMACFLLILSYVRFERSYDRFHQNAERIYRVLGDRGNMGKITVAPDPLVSSLRSEIPGIERVTQLYPPFGGKHVLQAGDNQFYESGLYADAHFLEVLSFPLIRGGRETALDGPSKIVLAKTTARKLFGADDPIGKTVTWKDRWEARELTVTAILEDVPASSHLKFDYLVSLDTLRSDKGFDYMFGNWRVSNFPIYLRLQGAVSKEAAEAAILEWLKGYAARVGESPPFQSFDLQPLTDIHLRSDFGGDIAVTGDLRYVRLFMAVAFIVLLIACVNYTNLTTARSAVRAREIGIRKVTGAYRTQVFQQFLGESFVVAALAGAAALGLVALFLPGLGALAGIPLRLKVFGSGGVWPWLVATVLFVSLSAGIYPALVLSSLQPIRTLREFAASGKKGSFLRNTLVISQFTVSVVLIVATLIVLSQMNYVKSARLGYNREHVVIIPAFEPETSRKMPAIKNDLEGRPEVVRVSQTSGLPTNIGQHWYGFKAVREDGTEVECGFQCDYVDENFLSVFEIGLAAGRDFLPGDRNAIILNEAAVEDIGWKQPAGKKLGFGEMEYEVVGVVEDFHFASLHSKIEPMALIYETGRQLAVRIRAGDVERTMGVLRSVFEKNTHGQPFDFFFLDDAFDALYRREIRAGEIFGAFAGLAVFIACLGLLGLTSYNVSRRTKEIGIRKVLGASVPALVLLLNRDFIRLVLIGNLLAWPLAYFAMSQWLENFAYRISIKPWIFLLASGLSLVGAFLVVGIQTAKAAVENPSDALRYE